MSHLRRYIILCLLYMKGQKDLMNDCTCAYSKRLNFAMARSFLWPRWTTVHVQMLTNMNFTTSTISFFFLIPYHQVTISDFFFFFFFFFFFLTPTYSTEKKKSSSKYSSNVQFELFQIASSERFEGLACNCCNCRPQQLCGFDALPAKSVIQGSSLLI